MQQLNDMQIRFLHTWDRMCMACFGRSQMDLPDLFGIWEKVPEVKDMDDGINKLYDMVHKMGAHLHMSTSDVHDGINRMDKQ